MATYTAVTEKDFGSKTWRPVDSFRFFAQERTAPLVAAEFPKACVAFPIAWLENGRGYEPVALLGLQQSENLFINGQQRWVGAYTPAHLRNQPFRLIPTDKERLTLGVREDLNLVSDTDAGIPFFNENGELSDEVHSVVDRLQKLETNRTASAIATQALADAGILTPWTLTPMVNGEKVRLGGLFHVSQEKLNNVDAQTLAELRDKGALAMAYCQQISQQLIQRLEMLHEQRAKAKTKRSSHPADQVDFGLGDDEGISFGGMGDSTDD